MGRIVSRVWAAVVVAGLGFAQSEEPQLRLELGMHTALIRNISVDAAGRFVVTAGEDKSTRIWDVATGKLLRVLRTPVGNGSVGKIYAVTITPDGRVVACAGYTGETVFSIYLF